VDLIYATGPHEVGPLGGKDAPKREKQLIMEQAVPEVALCFWHKRIFSLKIPLFSAPFLETGGRMSYNK
jgi:hypothetical protein